MSHNGLSLKDIEALRRIDSCTLANAIERLKVRPRSEGFVQGVISCKSPALPPVVGYAVTGSVRASTPPVNGHCYFDHIDWWHYVTSVPAPRVVVMLDADDPPGIGALFGEVHARICVALECAAYITNGAVRDLPAIETMGFHLFAGSLSVSHAYAHIVDFGHPVEIGGLTIRSGDLLHGDIHGVQSVPVEVARQLPAVAEEVLAEEQEIARMCMAADFSIDQLLSRMRAHSEGKKC